MDITITMTDEEAEEFIDMAYKQFPEDVVKQPKEILEFIIKSNTQHNKRDKLQKKFDKLTNKELDVLLANK